MAGFTPTITTISNSATVVVTSGSLNTSQIVKASVLNTDIANSHSVTVYSVSSGGSPGAGNEIYQNLVIAANTTVILSALQGQAVQFGGSVQASSDEAGVVVFAATVFSTP